MQHWTPGLNSGQSFNASAVKTSPTFAPSGDLHSGLACEFSAALFLEVWDVAETEGDFGSPTKFAGRKPANLLRSMSSRISCKSQKVLRMSLIDPLSMHF